mgnify:FL=1
MGSFAEISHDNFVKIVFEKCASKISNFLGVAIIRIIANRLGLATCITQCVDKTMTEVKKL